MSEPQFIPSGVPHVVEMPEGSHVAKSKSGSAGTDIRRTEPDQFAADQDIVVDPHHILLQADAVAGENIVKLARSDAIERARPAIAPAAQGVPAKAMSIDQGAHNHAAYDTEGQVMDFPARLIQLKIQNDVVREQLQVLENLMQGQNQ